MKLVLLPNALGFSLLALVISTYMVDAASESISCDEFSNWPSSVGLGPECTP